MAKSFGAADAAVLSTADVIVDPRVRLKCLIPKCYMSGGCSHCPPHGYSIDQVLETVMAHDAAIFHRVAVDPSIMAAKNIHTNIEEAVFDPAGHLFNLGGHFMLNFSIVKLLQKTARDMGYVSMAGFGGGSCRDVLCHLHPSCLHLTTGRCRHASLTSPAMESCGMDVFTMAAGQGWEVYPIGGTCDPGSVPAGSAFGLALVGAPGRNRTTLPVVTDYESRKKGAPRAHDLLSKRVDRTRKAWKLTWQALRHANATPGLVRHMVRERKAWSRFNRNLYRLVGSWGSVLEENLRLLEGRPRDRGKGC